MRYAQTLIMSVLVLVLGACDIPTPTPVVNVPPGTSDNTLPLLQVGSAGLRSDILVNQDSTQGQSRRARSVDDVLLSATGTDNDTGIRRVVLRGQTTIVCIPETGTNLVRIADPIYIENAVPPENSTLPITAQVFFTLDTSDERARCPVATRFYDLNTVLTAEAENGAGQVRQLPSAAIASYGPDQLRIGTFNLYNPGNHADSVYSGWGATLGSQIDVLLMQEVPDRRRAELVASAAGMPYVVLMNGQGFADTAIAARTPLRNVQREVIDPPGRLTSNDSSILSLETDIVRYPHQIIAAHWGIRDANDEEFGPQRSSPSRLEAAQAMLDMMNPAIPVYMGGDLNAYSGAGPQDHDNDLNTPDFVGGTAEIALLRTRLQDPFVVLGITDYCSNQRIDYILYSGQYAPVSYSACFDDSAGSDHPFVMATFVPI